MSQFVNKDKEIFYRDLRNKHLLNFLIFPEMLLAL